MVVYNNVLAGAAGSSGSDYTIERSLRFNDSDAAHLTKTFSAGNSQKWTWAAWVKRNKLGGYQTLFGHVSGGSGQHYIDFGGDKIRFTRYVSSNEAALETQAVYRDTSAWMHVCAIWDVGNSTANHRQRLFVNGLEVTEFSTRTNPSQNYTGGVISTAIEHHISKVLSQNYGAFQLADIYFLDGIVAGISTDDASGSITGTPNAAYLTDFGEFDSSTGVWNPVEYTGSHNGPAVGSGVVYSDGVSSPQGIQSSYPATNAFDGSTSTACTNVTTNGSPTLTVTFNPPLTNVTSLRMYTGNIGSNQYATGYGLVNGTSISHSTLGASYGAGWVDFTGHFSGTTVNSMGLGQTNAGTYALGLSINAIEVNGTILQDGIPAGVNGFHLPFSDDSAAYKLGKDAISTDTPLPCVDFDGNDHLQVAYSSDFNLGSSDFTIECYAKTTDDSTNYPSIVGKWQSQSASDWDFRPASDDANHNFFFIYRTGGNNISVNSGTSITDGKWHHIAVSRQSSNLRMFVDGALVHTHNIGSNTIQNTNMPLFLGYDPYGTSYYNGQTSNLRIVVGTALYTAAFTKPTTPLTNVTNTKLLCFQSDTSVTAAAVTPNSLTVSSGDPEARSVSDSDWTVNNISVSDLLSAGNAYDGSLNGYMPAGVTQATDPSQLASTSNRTHFFLVNQDNSINITVVATSTTMAVASSVYDGWGSNNPTTTLNDGTVTPSSSGSDTSVSGKTLAVNYFQNLTVGNTYTISTKNGGAGNPHRIHYVTGATVQNQPIVDSDSLLDSPTNYDDGTNIGGNYCVINPLSVPYQNPTVSDGNLTMTATGVNQGRTGTLAVPFSGKWYFEVTCGSGGSGVWQVGISDSNHGNDSVGARLLYLSDSRKQILLNGNVTFAGYGQGYTTGDTIGVAFDADNNTLTYYKNGTSLGAAYTNVSDYLGDSITPYLQLEHSGRIFYCNFGQKPFAYPLTGYKSWCTQNLPDPLIADGSAYFQAKTFTGNGSTQSITTTGMSPDWVWIKNRGSVENHSLSDTVRGANKQLQSSTNTAETTHANQLTSFNTNGFTVGSSSQVNQNNVGHVAWAWDAGSSNTSISVGSLNSSAYNSGEVWSTTGTLSVDLNGSTVSNMTGPLTKAFEGSLASSSMVYEGTAYTSGTKTYTYTFGTAQTNITSARVYLYQGNSAEGGATGFGNGTINKTQDGTYGWVDASSTIPANGTVTAMTMTTTATSGVNSSRNGFIAIELNGKMLLDNGVTPVDNFPSIASTVRANPTAGFSIVSFSGNATAGATVGHGLNDVPAMYIVKRRDSSDGWYVYHKDVTTGKVLILNTTDAENTSSFTNSTEPTNSVFTLGSAAAFNASGSPFIGYCISPVSGYSSVGKYTGNGSSSGPFVPTGFRPRWLMIKRTDSTSNWVIVDAARSSFNEVNDLLYAEQTLAETVDDGNNGIDFLSNGFKLRKGVGGTNINGATLIYIAFAESPFKYARAR